MFLPQLNPKLFHQAIINGCEAIVREKDQLNAINIFPVADNDTGDNLASTAIAVINNDGRESTFNELFQTLANASLMGARGNSGIIFSQFFNALAMTSFDKKQMSLDDLAAVLTNTALLVRASIACPIDGTILTMIESFAEASRTLSKKTPCFNQLMKKLLPILQDKLKKTTNSLPVLKKAKIVDAGALGFYIFVEGFAAFLSGSIKIKPNKEKRLSYTSEHPIIIPDSPPLHRYCTEALLSAEFIDHALLTKCLEKKGDSLAFTGNQKMRRLHIHTNTPRDVFSTLMSHGAITAPKVDDMLRQYQIGHDKIHNIALVTDSSADIPQALLDEYQIHLIPLNIHLDEHTLLDKYCLEPHSFYHNLKCQKSHPKTSLPSIPLIEEKLGFLSQHYDKVIFISIAKAMSGTFDVVSQVAKKYNNVAVIDSRTNSGAQGLLVQYAGELIRSQRSFQSIMKAMEEAISETSIFVMVNEFESMVRSGRVNAVAGQIARLSGVKPIIFIDNTGKGSFYSSAFSTKGALSKIVKIIEQLRCKPGKELAEYCIVHAGVEEKAKDFAEQATKALQKPPAFIENVSAVIGLHAGQGCIALAARMRSAKDGA